MVRFENATLAEKQMYYYNGTHCIYCCGDTDLVDSIEVYQESYGLIYICRNCKAWVNCHKGGDQAFGTIAKKELRDLRHECHLMFDPLWMKRVSQGVKIKAARAAAYAWAAKILDLTTLEGHIGYWNEEQCKRIIEECKKYHLTEDQKAQKAREQKWRSDIIFFLSGELDYQVKEFKMNNIHHFELKHHSGKTWFYDINTKKGAWEAKKKKWKPIEDIEAFIYENFKR